MRPNGSITEGTLSGDYLIITVALKNSTKRSNVRIHRIIAATFLGRNDDLLVNHKDGNKLNNNSINLEYVTNQENVIHAYNTGLNKHIRRIYQFDLQGNFIKEYPSIAQAARENNCNKEGISSVLRGLTMTAYNYLWQYADYYNYNYNLCLLWQV